MDHKILIKKLYNLGIRGAELKWFEDYLSNRMQYVSLDDICSSLIKIMIGVPQGSILGPLLFLIYINDLPLSTQLLVLMFADDTTLLASGTNIDDLYAFVNIELHRISTYFRLNRMALHPEKTNYILFTNSPTAKDTNLQLFINNHNLNEEFDEKLIKSVTRVVGNDGDPAVKFLGVFIDPKLNFKFHVSNLLKKLSSALYFMRSAKNFLTYKALKFMYYSIFHSHLIYQIHAWSTCSQSSINEVFKMQKKALRIMNSASYNSHTESLFKSSSILPLPSLIQFFKLQFMQKYIQGFLPSLFDNVWVTAEAHFQAGEIRYALQNRENFYLPICRLTSLEKHPYFMFPRLWQEFDNENVKIVRDTCEFKTKLKKYFLNKLNSNYTCNRLLCPHCHFAGIVDPESEGSP